MNDGPEFLPGIKNYGEFRSRLKDAEEAEEISEKKKDRENKEASYNKDVGEAQEDPENS